MQKYVFFGNKRRLLLSKLEMNGEILTPEGMAQDLSGLPFIADG